MSKYYIPKVSAEGVLTWTPTDPSMPAVDAAVILGPEGKIGIRGPQGIPGIAGADGTVSFNELTETQLQMLTGPEGDCGVYVGESEPFDDGKLIWVDTSEDFNDEMATKAYVDEAIVRQISGGEVTLDAYATKTYVTTEVNAALTNYYTRDWVDSTLEDYYTKAQIDSILSTWAAAEGVPSSEGVDY